MAGLSRGVWLGLCSIILAISHIHASCNNVASFFGDADIATKLSQMIPNHRRITAGDLPQSRPPAPSAVGWELCSWNCMESSSVKVGERGETRGVYELEAVFKPLPGVNSSMMVWLFENLHRNAVNVVDGKTYPMYLLFHPVDHLFHTAEPADDVGVGTVFTWCEIPLTGCTYNRLSATEPWTCPTQRRGFVQSDPASTWQMQYHTKVNMTITRFDQNGIEFITREKNPFFGGPDNTRTVVTTRHTWTDSSKGLLLKTQQYIGLMAPGSNTEFDTTLIAPIANLVIKDQYLDNAANIPKGNITAAAHMAVLHYLQEYGSLPKWLPKLYQNRTNKRRRQR